MPRSRLSGLGCVPGSGVCGGLLYLGCTEFVLLISAEPVFACGEVFPPGGIESVPGDWFVSPGLCRIAFALDGGLWIDVALRLWGRLEDVVPGLCARVATPVASTASVATYASGFIERLLWSAAGADTCLLGLLCILPRYGEVFGGSIRQVESEISTPGLSGR